MHGIGFPFGTTESRRLVGDRSLSTFLRFRVRVPAEQDPVLFFMVAHESVSILPWGSLRASGDRATNSVRQRCASGSTLVEGAVSPSASLGLDAALPD